MLKLYAHNPTLIIVAIIALLIIISIIFILFSNNDAKYAEVYKDGELISVYNLDENKSVKIISDKVENGYNMLEISDGKAYIIEANCPDGICVKIKEQKVITCLPHGLIIMLGGGEPETDGTTR